MLHLTSPMVPSHRIPNLGILLDTSVQTQTILLTSRNIYHVWSRTDFHYYPVMRKSLRGRLLFTKKALLEAGYKDEIIYEKFAYNKKTRKRNIIWFKPPWSDTIITKIGSLFLKLIEKHFPSNDPLRKLFNKNSLKLSYGCLPNVNSFISAQNRKLLSNISTDKVQCNCRGGVTACPVNGRCKEENVVYKVTVNMLENSKTYIGSTVNFKDRFNQHQSSFRLHKYKNNISLSRTSG